MAAGGFLGFFKEMKYKERSTRRNIEEGSWGNKHKRHSNI